MKQTYGELPKLTLAVCSPFQAVRIAPPDASGAQKHDPRLYHETPGIFYRGPDARQAEEQAGRPVITGPGKEVLRWP